MSSIGVMGTSGGCAFLTFFCSDKAESPVASISRTTRNSSP